MSVPSQSWHDPDAALCQVCGHHHPDQECYMACGCNQWENA